jgi:hypothetical protein
MTNKISHTRQILDHLEKGNAITPIDALRMFGCFRLGARIYDLKRMGAPVIRRMVTAPNGKRYAEYFLGDEQ